jgi:hypothetical protein
MYFVALESHHEEDLKLLSFGESGPKVGGAKRNFNEHLPPPRMIMNISREEACM